jgi:hypothetical protein
MNRKTRALKTRYRQEHTELVPPEDPAEPTVRRPKDDAPGLKAFAATQPEGPAWLERKQT